MPSGRLPPDARATFASVFRPFGSVASVSSHSPSLALFPTGGTWAVPSDVRPGALTGPLSGVPWKRTRQIAANKVTYAARHSTGFPDPTLHCAVVRSWPLPIRSVALRCSVAPSNFGHLGSTVSTASVCGRRAGEWRRSGATVAEPQMEGNRFCDAHRLPLVTCARIPERSGRGRKGNRADR